MANSNLDKDDIIFMMLQFLDEEKFKNTLHILGQESGLLLSMKYVEEAVHKGNWDELVKYLLVFTKLDENQHSIKMFFEIRKQQYFEALEDHDHNRAVEILQKDLKVFEKYEKELLNEMGQLLVLEDFRQHKALSSWYIDTLSARSILSIVLGKLIEDNPKLKDKLRIPSISKSRLCTLVSQSLSNYQYPPFSENSRAPNPHTGTFFTDNTYGFVPETVGVPIFSAHQLFQPVVEPVPTDVDDWLSLSWNPDAVLNHRTTPSPSDPHVDLSFSSGSHYFVPRQNAHLEFEEVNLQLGITDHEQ